MRVSACLSAFLPTCLRRVPVSLDAERVGFAAHVFKYVGLDRVCLLFTEGNPRVNAFDRFNFTMHGELVSTQFCYVRYWAVQA